MRNQVVMRKIDKLAEKITLICRVLELNNAKDFLKILDKERCKKISWRSVQNWAKECVVPHISKIHLFLRALDINPDWIHLSLEEFCAEISNKFSVNSKEILGDMHQSDVYLDKISKIKSVDWMRRFSREFLGYWHVYYMAGNGQIVKGLCHFHHYKEGMNTILCNFVSAEQKSIDWTHTGHLMVSHSFIHLFLQTITETDVEVITIMANIPSQTLNRMNGLIMSNEPADGCIIPRPKSSRAYLEKIDPVINLKKARAEVGYHDESLVNPQIVEKIKGLPLYPWTNYLK